MKSKEHRCNYCDVSLDDENWIPSAKKTGRHVCKPCNRARSKKYKARAKLTNPAHVANQRAIEKLKLKLETMLAYGNKCVGCDENKTLFLTLDHINNNGHMDSDIGRGVDLYAHLKRLGYPGKGTQLQILCHNCNALKEMNRRECDIPVSTQKEIYVKQPYTISKEQDNALWEAARAFREKLAKPKSNP